MAEDKDKGLYQKYEVKKFSNPDKEIDAIVLEFDDPLSWDAIARFAMDMHAAGYELAAYEINAKLEAYKLDKELEELNED